ncbi:DUF58 domain-containing protein [Paenibacillus beijingensis]|uniref:Uncharacterized protein n=1 Tax=Paenibacillus beijingensis TaxID=1126833 RepID=A0A0D5NG46_9BACL|nr:DUF58 domain-containing protein [Paenibacillus beijingensis]AJY74359.1 hypothetical protein VN24_06940 [Paenibacillus beijingensis]
MSGAKDGMRAGVPEGGTPMSGAKDEVRAESWRIGGAECEAAGAPRPRRAAWTALALLWAGSLTAVLLRGGAAEWFAAAGLGGLMLFCWVAPRLSLGELEAVRTIDAAAPLRRGEEGAADVELTLKVVRGRVVLPLVWLHIREELVNESAVSKRPAVYDQLVLPWFTRKWSVRYSTGRLRRGAHRFRAVTVTAGDLFGLTAVRRTYACDGEIVVPPGQLPLAKQPDHSAVASNNPRGGRQKLHAGEETATGRKRREPGGGIDSRAYHPGDPLRHIDWRADAKGRGMRTKLRHPEDPPYMLIVLDTAEQSYESSDRLFNDCASLTLEMIGRAVFGGCGVRLLGGAGEALTVAAGDRQGVARAAERLARMRMDAGEAPLELAGLAAAAPLPRGAAMLFVTACWRDGSGLLRLAERAAAAGFRLELAVIVRRSVLSAAMLERQRQAEVSGIKVRWVQLPDAGGEDERTAAKGGVRHASER